jgi:hypothetical protein
MERSEFVIDDVRTAPGGPARAVWVRGGRIAGLEAVGLAPAGLARVEGRGLPAFRELMVGSDKIGRVRTCRIEPAVLRTVEHWISERRTSWERHFDRLGEYLAATEPPEQTAELSVEGSERGRDDAAKRPE